MFCLFWDRILCYSPGWPGITILSSLASNLGSFSRSLLNAEFLCVSYYARVLSNSLLNVVPPSWTLNTFHLVMVVCFIQTWTFQKFRAAVEYLHASFNPLPVCMQLYISTGSYRQLSSKLCSDLPVFRSMAFVHPRSQSRVARHSSYCWQSLFTCFCVLSWRTHLVPHGHFELLLQYKEWAMVWRSFLFPILPEFLKNNLWHCLRRKESNYFCRRELPWRDGFSFEAALLSPSIGMFLC